MKSGGGNEIEFYIEGIYCQAESGMTFSEWIMSDYYDITNPYKFIAPDGSTDVRNFILNYGGGFYELTLGSGIGFNPKILLSNSIIPNQTYVVNLSNYD